MLLKYIQIQKKRYCCFPKQRVEFVAAVMKENKRIHCTVKAYTDVHRQLEKQQRKEKRKAEKKLLEKSKRNQINHPIPFKMPFCSYLYQNV